LSTILHIRVITKLPNNLPKGKAKLICQQTDKISQQSENWENRNDPDLVQAFPKKWWVESKLTALNLPPYLFVYEKNNINKLLYKERNRKIEFIIQFMYILVRCKLDP
jgi:hypothetical protein